MELPQSISLTKGADGGSIAEWSDSPRDDAETLRIRVPGLENGEWFFVNFSHQMVALEPLVESIPQGFKQSESGWSLPDPLGAGDSSIGPFDALSNGINAPYPNEAQVEAGLYGSHPSLDVSATGDTLLWPADVPDVPMKHRYECVSSRNIESESSVGTPSGVGWHTVRYKAKAIVNSLEERPFLVALGQTQLVPPPELTDGMHAYGLWDVAVFRWLHPGEAALSVEPNIYDANGVSFTRSQHAWLLADDDEKTRCYETWFYPCAPQAPDSFSCPGVEVVFYATDVPAEPGDTVGVAGTAAGLGEVLVGDDDWDGVGALDLTFDAALDKWTGAVRMPPGTAGTYALFVRRGDGTVVWEKGERALQTTGVDGELHQMQWFN